MALLLETTLGDVTIDLDLEGSPKLCENILRLAKVRYYTQCLLYYVGRGICKTGDPSGTGTGGACWEGLVDAHEHHSGDVIPSTKRFLSSSVGSPIDVDVAGPTTTSSIEKGCVLAMELEDGIPNTIGSQFLIVTESNASYFLNKTASKQPFLSLGRVTEDPNHVLDQLNDSTLLCDANGRPYTDIRILRAHILHDPFDDPPELRSILKERNVTLLNDSSSSSSVVLPLQHVECARWLASSSPTYERPKEEVVEKRVMAKDLIPLEDDSGNDNDDDDDETKQRRLEESEKRDTQSRAVVLEMLGDLPSADMKPPENVLFVCKLNPITEEDDLELIFSRFDNDVKVDLIRDGQTGASLQYAFVEFTSEQQCNEAYFKMNNALIDDRRIKVDFSQSVSKLWNKYTQQKRNNRQPQPQQQPPTMERSTHPTRNHHHHHNHHSIPSSSNQNHHGSNHHYHTSKSSSQGQEEKQRSYKRSRRDEEEIYSKKHHHHRHSDDQYSDGTSNSDTRHRRHKRKDRKHHRHHHHHNDEKEKKQKKKHHRHRHHHHDDYSTEDDTDGEYSRSHKKEKKHKKSSSRHGHPRRNEDYESDRHRKNRYHHHHHHSSDNEDGRKRHKSETSSSSHKRSHRHDHDDKYHRRHHHHKHDYSK